MGLLKKGDQMRLKVNLIGAWNGIGFRGGVGTVIYDQYSGSDLVEFSLNDDPSPNQRCLAVRNQVSKVRNPLRK